MCSELLACSDLKCPGGPKAVFWREGGLEDPASPIMTNQLSYDLTPFPSQPCHPVTSPDSGVWLRDVLEVVGVPGDSNSDGWQRLSNPVKGIL